MSTGTQDVESAAHRIGLRAGARAGRAGGGRRGRGVRPRVLPPRAGGRPARARAGRPLRRRAVALDLRARPRAGRAARARLQPDVRAARLAVAAHRDRHRLRRHAVPRGLGEHGAQPARARHPRARAPGRSATSPTCTSRSTARRTASRSSADALRGVLAQVRAAVEDWQPMRERMQALIDEPAPAGVDAAEVEEARALLAWVGDHHFTFLGYREYALDGERAARRRGLRARAAARRRRATSRPRSPSCRRRCARWRSSRDLLVLTKANDRSPDPPAELPRLRRRQALRRRAATWSASAASSASTRRSPTARCRRTSRCCGARSQAVRRARRVPARQPRRQGAGRDHRHLPARRALPDRAPTSSTRSRAGSSSWASASACGCSCAPTATSASSPAWSSSRATASTPPTGCGSARSCSEALGAETVDWGLRLTEWVLVRIHYTLRVAPGDAARRRRGRARGADRRGHAQLGRRAAGRADRGGRRGEPARRCYRRYGSAFPAAYRDDLLARSAVADVQRIEALEGDDALDLSLYRPLEARAGRAALQALPARRARVAVRRAADVRDARADGHRRAARTRSRRATAPPAWIYDFGLQARGRRSTPTRSASASTRASRASGTARPSTTASTG